MNVLFLPLLVLVPLHDDCALCMILSGIWASKCVWCAYGLNCNALVKARYGAMFIDCVLDRVWAAHRTPLYSLAGWLAYIEMLTGCRHAVYVLFYNFSILRSHLFFLFSASVCECVSVSVSFKCIGHFSGTHARVLCDGKPWILFICEECEWEWMRKREGERERIEGKREAGRDG